MKQRLILCVGILFSALLQARPIAASDVQKFFYPLVADGTVVGASVAVLQNGKIDFYHFGHTTLGGIATATNETKYEIASITKLFTGTLMGMAVNDGKVVESDEAQKYLPHWKLPTKNGIEISVLDFCTHRSGFNYNFWQSENEILDIANPWASFGNAGLKKYLEREPLDFVPGTNAHYDNIGVGLAGQLLEQRYSVSLEQLLQNKIFDPLKMQNSGVNNEHTGDASFATGYGFVNNVLRKIPLWYIPDLSAMGGIHSTLEDMAKFASFILKPAKGELQEALALAMKQRMPTLEPLAQNETIGLLWRYLPETKLYWHNGATYGMNSFLGINIEKNAAVVILSNTGPKENKVTPAGFYLSSLFESQD